MNKLSKPKTYFKTLKKKKSLLNFKISLPQARWINYKRRYGFGVRLKKYFDCLFDKAFSYIFFKKLQFLNKKHIKDLEYSIYLIRPEFRIDIFLWRLNFFSSCYEARSFIHNKEIKLNESVISHANYFLKCGDVISFNSKKFYTKSKFKLFLNKRISNFKLFTFLEIDYYTNTFFILKDFRHLTRQDLFSFIRKLSDVDKFKRFIE